MNALPNSRNKKTPVKKSDDAITNENSKISSASLISTQPQSSPETKQENSKHKAAFYNLTDKELAIIKSLSKGNSYKMIATDCNVSINTVRQHIRNIHQKLKVHSSMETVVLALKENLLFTSFFSSFSFSFF